MSAVHAEAPTGLPGQPAALTMDAPPLDERLEATQAVLSEQEIDLAALRKLASAGLPAGAKVRARVWQLLLGYLPPNRSRWAEVVGQRRAEYASFREDFMVNATAKCQDDDPLGDGESSAWNEYFKDQEEQEQIHRDLERTHQDLPFFSTESPDSAEHRHALQNILFVFSKLNPGLKYVQGMNELVAPIYMVFVVDAATPEDAEHAEADTFFCFVKLLTISENRDLYCRTLDQSNSGVANAMREFFEYLQASDPALQAHLVAEKVDPHYFAFRWVTCLFSQDLETMDHILRVWDFLLGDPRGCKDALMRFSVALVVRRRILLLSTNFPEIIKALQSLGKEGFDAEEAVMVALSLRPRRNGQRA